MGSSLGAGFQTFYALFMISIVLFLAYVVTRFVGKKYMKTMKGKNIKIIESVSMGLDKMLYLVKVGEQYFLLSSSGKNINNISEVDPSSVTYNEDEEDENIQAIFTQANFSKYLDSFKDKFMPKDVRKKKTSKFENKKKAAEIVTDDVAVGRDLEKNIGKIRDIFENVKTPDKNGAE